MKKLFTFGLVVALAGTIFAIDRKITDYAMHGKADSLLVQTAIDSSSGVISRIGTAIDTMSKFQHRPIIASLSPSVAVDAEDSIYYSCFSVPAGMTATIRAVTLSAAVEYDAENGSVELMLVEVVGTDTIVAPVSIDDDSAAYNDVALSLTVITAAATDLDAGDLVMALVMVDSAIVVATEGAILTLDVDFDE